MINIKKLVLNQAYYDECNRIAAQMENNWDVKHFVLFCLERGDTGDFMDHCSMYTDLIDKMEKSVLPYDHLDKKYAWELFLVRPAWGSRGAPLFWAYAARQFTYDVLPLDEEWLKEKYLSIARSFGIDPDADDEYFYIEQFAAGGMSSGRVGSHFVRNTLNMLLEKNKEFAEQKIL